MFMHSSLFINVVLPWVQTRQTQHASPALTGSAEWPPAGQEGGGSLPQAQVRKRLLPFSWKGKV